MNDRVVFETEDAQGLMADFIEARTMSTDGSCPNMGEIRAMSRVRYLSEWMDDAGVPAFVREPIMRAIFESVWNGCNAARIAESVLLFAHGVALLRSHQTDQSHR